ncbi:CG0192 family protein [Corynebacterium sp. S7]
MSGTAKIYDADVYPTKSQIAKKFGAITDLIGSYRFVDPEDVVGIEVLVGRDMEGRLMQLPLVYTSDVIEGEALISTMKHSILGKRYVGVATASPAAVKEFIRVILNGDNGAAYSDGSGPQVEVKGSGDLGVEVGDINIREFTRQRSTGSVLIDGRSRSYFLRIPNLLLRSHETARGHTTSRMRLSGWRPENPADPRVMAELSWGDMLK